MSRPRDLRSPATFHPDQGPSPHRHTLAIGLVLAGLLAGCTSEPPAPQPRAFPFSRAPLGTLQLDDSVLPALSGTFTFPAGCARFTATLDDRGVGQVVFTLVRSGQPDMVISSRVSSPSDGAVVYNGVSITGRGALSSEQQAVIQTISDSDLLMPLALVPMELGCLRDDPATARQRAALLLPFQVLLKYGSTLPDVSYFEAQSSCSYLFDVPEAPRKHGLQFAKEDRVPNIFGYFALDEVAAVEHPVQLMHAGDASICFAECRGTCGPDCEPAACVINPGLWRCLTGMDGGNTGWKQRRKTWTCGSHQGCREHDACYDLCHQMWGCGTWRAALCRRGCDARCVADFGSGNCLNWMYGLGPFDQQLIYFHDYYELDQAMCPMSTPDMAVVPADMAFSPWDMAAADQSLPGGPEMGPADLSMPGPDAGVPDLSAVEIGVPDGASAR